jgi:hypothetical protein
MEGTRKGGNSERMEGGKRVLLTLSRLDAARPSPIDAPLSGVKKKEGEREGGRGKGGRKDGRREKGGRRRGREGGREGGAGADS